MPLGFDPLSGAPLSALGAPAAATPGVFMAGLGTLGCGTGCGCQPNDCCLDVCSPCAIPEKDLTISWVNPLAGNNSDTLVYNGSGSWTTGCSGGAGVGNQIIFTLGCTGGQTDFRAHYFVSGSCPTGQTNYCGSLRSVGFQLNLGSSTCSPYSVTYNLTTMSCPTLSASGFTSFTISDPSPLYGAVMCQRFCLNWCGDVNGATVKVYTSMGGSLLATGTTNSSGCVNLSWNGEPGSYYVTASATNYPSAAETVTLECNGITNIPLPAGYGCCVGGYQYPLPLTLYATVCGQMMTLTARFTSGLISNWQSINSFSITSSGVAMLTMCTSGNCIWDGVSTTTDVTYLGLELQCNGTGLPLLSAGVDIVTDQTTDNSALFPAACQLAFPGACGNGFTNIEMPGCGFTSTFPTTGTWNNTVSLTGTLGTSMMNFHAPPQCVVGSGCMFGATVTITN